MNSGSIHGKWRMYKSQRERNVLSTEAELRRKKGTGNNFKFTPAHHLIILPGMSLELKQVEERLAILEQPDENGEPYAIPESLLCQPHTEIGQLALMLQRTMDIQEQGAIVTKHLTNLTLAQAEEIRQLKKQRLDDKGRIERLEIATYCLLQ